MLYNPSAYVREAGAPGELQKHVTDIQGSGLVTVILGMLHFGDPVKDPTMELGDFIYNNYPDDLIVRGGKFNPHGTDTIKRWPAQVAKLKQQGSVSLVLLSVGSPPEYWPDFGTIQKMLADPAKTALLKQNIAALRTAFTVNGVCAIDGFDIDCEEFDIYPPEKAVPPEIIVKFCEIVFEQGFQVTFCPYGSRDKWQYCMKTLWDSGRHVSGWNLQCYAGGGGNRGDLSPWLKALASVVKERAPYYLMPGLAVKSAVDVNPEDDRLCPSQVEATVAGWKNRELGGVFLWMYDSLSAKNSGECGGTNKLANYIEAIKQGMNKA